LIEYFIWLVCACRLKQIIWDNPMFWWVVLRIVVYLLPVAANRVIYEVVDRKYKPGMRIIIGAYVVLTVLAVAGELLNFGALNILSSVFYIMLPILELIAVYWVVMSAKRGIPYSQALLVPLLALAGFGTLDGLAAHFHWLPVGGYFLPYATLAVVFFLACIMREQIKRERYLSALASGLEGEVAKAIERAEVDALTKML